MTPYYTWWFNRALITQSKTPPHQSRCSSRRSLSNISPGDPRANIFLISPGIVILHPSSLLLALVTFFSRVVFTSHRLLSAVEAQLDHDSASHRLNYLWLMVWQLQERSTPQLEKSNPDCGCSSRISLVHHLDRSANHAEPRATKMPGTRYHTHDAAA